MPALDEVPNAPRLVARYRGLIAAHPRYDFELVLVDHGSTDGTAAALMGRAKAARHLNHRDAIVRTGLGYTQTRVDYDQLERTHGTSRWTRRKMIKLAIDSLIQFSSLPLRVCTLAGMVVAALGMVYAVVLLVRSLAGVDTPAGWPTVIVIVLVVGGTQLTVMGGIGEYLWRAVEETRQRPLNVVRDVQVARRGHRASHPLPGGVGGPATGSRGLLAVGRATRNRRRAHRSGPSQPSAEGAGGGAERRPRSPAAHADVVQAGAHRRDLPRSSL